MTEAQRLIAALSLLILLSAAACTSGAPPRDPVQPGDITSEVGVSGKEISLGELSPLTGPASVMGLPLTRGHEVYFHYVNEVLGGIGRNLDEGDRFKVRLVTKNTTYTESGHIEAYNEIKDQVLMIAQSFGSATTKAILKQVNDDKILVAPASLSSEWLPEKYLITAGAPYPAQFVNAAQYLKDQETQVKAGIIYQDDAYGQQGVKGLELAAREFGFEIVARSTFQPNDTNLGDQVTEMKNAGATHVFLTTIPPQTRSILSAGAQAQYAPRWIGQSPSWTGSLLQSPEVTYMEQTVWVVTDAFCGWGDTGSGCEGMQAMLENIQKFAPDQQPDYYFSFGYAQAKVVHEVLEKAVVSGDLSREGLVSAFESMPRVDMGGLLNPISFGPDCEDRIPVTASTIWRFDPAAPVGLAVEKDGIDSAAVEKLDFC